jgi:serine protease Do
MPNCFILRTPKTIRHALVCLAVCGVSYGWLANGVLAAHASELRKTPIVQAVAGARESVVNIHGQKMLTAADDPQIPGDSPRKVNGMGTGVVIDERGYIITNFHVVDGVKKIEVTLFDESTATAQLVSTDPVNDLAVVKIDVPRKLQVITIGTSNDLMVGETVIALGNAYGYENTATDGIVSAIHRSVQVSDSQSYEDLIQTDASINPGNSGGPLLNIDGEMIGINVAVRAGAQGIGFAIPIDKAMTVAAKLISTERVERKYHGVKMTDTPGHADGAVITSVDDDSPAAKGGLKAGDTITAVDGKPICRAADFDRAMLGRALGQDVAVTVRRNSQTVNADLALAALPSKAADPSDATWEMLGLKLQPIAPQQFKQQYQSRYRGGLNVVAVRPDGPAAKQGIRRGDVLVGMHIWETVSLDNVEYVLNRSDFTEFEPVKFYILRGSETLYGHLPVSLQRR